MSAVIVSADPTVFVVDSDVTTCEALRGLARMMGYACEICGSGRQFLDRFDRRRSGCLVLELDLPECGGLQLQHRLVQQGVLLPILFLTSHGTLAIAVRAMRAGAFHFLEKPFREHELWDAIEEAVQIDRRRRAAALEWECLQERLARLTHKEEQVLAMIAEGKPNRTIAKELDVSVRTIEFRRNGLMKKLEVATSHELLRLALVACNRHESPWRFPSWNQRTS